MTTTHESYAFKDTTPQNNTVGMFDILTCSDHQNYGFGVQACL